MSKIVVITGTSKGIGKSLAIYYLSKNCIVIGCSRTKSVIDDINYRHFELDVCDEKAVASATMLHAIAETHKNLKEQHREDLILEP